MAQIIVNAVEGRMWHTVIASDEEISLLSSAVEWELDKWNTALHRFKIENASFYYGEDSVIGH